MTADLEPYVCTAQEARELTDKIAGTVTTAWVLLSDAHDKRVWIPLGYPTWEAYVKAEFNISRSRSYHLMDQAKVIREVEAVLNAFPADRSLYPMSTSVDITEAAARELKPILPEVLDGIKARVNEDTPPDVAADIARDEIAKARASVVKVTETTKTETYVDGATGEIVAPPIPGPADAIAEAMRRPSVVIGKTIERLETVILGFQDVTVDEAIADIPDGHHLNADGWLATLDIAIPLLEEFRSGLRRRNLRSVK